VGATTSDRLYNQKDNKIMWKKLKLWLFPTEVEGFNYNAVDRDGDGKIQEGTPFERKVTTVKKTTKKAAAKKPAEKKTTDKKAPAKKTPAKKTVKKSTPKKTK
jgi:hypothetical protein